MTSSLLKILRQGDRVAAREESEKLNTESIDRRCVGLDMSGMDLTGLDMSGFRLRRARFDRTSLHGVSLDRADVSGSSFQCAGMEKMSATGADFTSTYLHATAMQVCNFADADMRHIKDATGGLFHGCSLKGARVSGNISGSLFYQCNLDGVDLSDAVLSDASFVDSSLRNAVMQRLRAQATTFRNTNLEGVDMREAYLYGAIISGTTPNSVNMRRAKLDRAVLIQAYISADLTDSSLVGAQCAYSRLNQSCLVNADIRGIDLRNASTLKTDFTGAIR